MNSHLTVACVACLIVQGHCKRLVHKQQKRIAAASAALLSCTMVAGVVALFGPDPANLPVTTVTHPVQSLADEQPLPALLDIPSYSLYRSGISTSKDTAESLLQRLGIADADARNFLRRDALVQQNLMGRAGRIIAAETSEDHRLLRLLARWAPDDSGNFKRLVVERDHGADTPRFHSRIEVAPLTVSQRLAGGIIHSSLFAATDDANIPDSVAVQIAEIFAPNIDFNRALRKGDLFSVVYETLEADGEPLRSGRVLSAQFHNKGNIYDALWFQQGEDGKGAYYTLDGESMRRTYLASPVKFNRVSSDFGQRIHPISKEWRMHKGIDLTAATGTPVRTVGDGVVEVAGWQRGYGNVVYVKHRDQHLTVYAHLSRIDVKKGQHVNQGQTIGAVGQTGWANGPHLHFEFRVKGVHQDPMRIVRDSLIAQPVPSDAREAFDHLATSMRAQLALVAAPLQWASNAR